MFGGDQKQGCGLTPGTIVAVAVAFLWMTQVVPLYQRWRYPPPPPEKAPAAQDNAEEAKRARIEKLRATAKILHEAGNDDAADILLAAAERLEKGEGAIPPPPRLTPSAGREATREAADAIVDATGAPGSEAARKLAAVARKPPPEGTAVGKPPEPPEAEKPPPGEPEPEPRTLSVRTDEFEIDFSTRGASVVRAALRKYRFKPGKEEPPLDMLLPLRAEGDHPGAAGSFILRPREDSEFGVDLSERVWDLAEDRDAGRFDGEGKCEVVFRKRIGSVRFTKTYTLHEKGFVFDVAVEARNDGKTPTKTLAYDIVGPNGLAPDDVAGRYWRMQATLAGRNLPDGPIKLMPIDTRKAAKTEIDERSFSPRVKEWAAVKNRYFAAVFQTGSSDLIEAMFAEPIELAERHKEDEALQQANLAAVMRLKPLKLDPGTARQIRFRTYLGPLQARCMGEEGGKRGWDVLITFGWSLFAWLSRLLLILLNVFHYFTQYLGSIVGGYGLAILFLTMAVKGGLHPLQRKAMISMHKMQKVAPEMKAIRKRHEKDKSREGQRKVQLEIMALYKKHGVSPLGGCLPMLVQIPMFIALFGMLRGAFELRHESYLWISDLTHPDRLIPLPSFNIPLLSRMMGTIHGINLLPVAYLGLTFLQQHLQPKPEDPEARKQQNMMKYMMIFFFFIFYNMAAALVLYFVFSNAFGILEQWYIRTYLIPEAEAATAKAASGAGAPAAYAPPTSWDKEAQRGAKQAEKRKRRKERRQPPGAM